MSKSDAKASFAVFKGHVSAFSVSFSEEAGGYCFLREHKSHGPSADHEVGQIQPAASLAKNRKDHRGYFSIPGCLFTTGNSQRHEPAFPVRAHTLTFQNSVRLGEKFTSAPARDCTYAGL